MAEGPEIKVKYTADVGDLKKGSAEAKKEVGSIEPVAKKTGGAVQEMGDLFAKASLIAGGTFVTAALAMAAAIGNANVQVNELDRSVRISSGTQQNYAQGMKALQSISDNYNKSIFSLASGFNELTRETRGTVNEGEKTTAIFDTIVSASDKIGVSVDDTTSSFSGFIDKMKQGTVDSTGLANEVDKRLYEAFVKVAQQMGLTNGELNEVLKTSDEAVATVLPQLAQAFGDSLGDIPQKDAKDLAEGIEYANSKLVVLLDSLFKVSGAKSVFAQAAEDAGDLLGQLTILSQKQGVTGVVLGLMDAGAETLLNGTGFKGNTLETARNQQSINQQTPSIGSKFTLPGELGNYSRGPIQPNGQYDVLAEALKNREEAEAAANKKLIAEQKRLANERKRALDEVSRQEMAEARERLAMQISDALSANEAAYRKNNGVLGAMGQLRPTGTKLEYDYGKDKFRTEFSNPTNGGGQVPNFDKQKEQILALGDAWTKEANAKALSIKTNNELAASLADLNVQLTEIVKQGKIDFFTGLGESLGEISVDLSSIEGIGDRVAIIMGNAISQIGKAVIAYAFTMEGLKDALKATFSNPYVALAVGVAAVAAGTALKSAATKHSQAASKGLWTGGIVGGRAGIDNVNTSLSPKEMVITEAQQNRLWGFISGTNNGSMMDGRYSPSSGGSSSGGSISIESEIRFRGSDLYVSQKKGKRKNDYFST